MVVEVFDHGRVDLHPARVVALLALAQFMPGGAEAFELAGPDRGRYDSQRPRARQPRLEQQVVSGVVVAGVPVDEIGRCLERPMGSRIGCVSEERTPVAAMLVNVLNKLVGIGTGGKEIRGRALYPIVAFNVLLLGDGKMVSGTRQQREGSLESAVAGPASALGSQVPFSSHVGVVSGIGKPLRQCRDPFVKIAFVTDLPVDTDEKVGSEHRTDAGDVVVGSRQQHGPGGRAGGQYVEVGEPDRLFGQLVQTRRADFPAVCADIGVAEVVRDDEQEIGRAGTTGELLRHRRRAKGGRQPGQQQNQASE